MTRNVIGIPNSSPVLAYCPAQSRTSAFCHMNQCLPQGGLSSSNTCLLHLVRPMATCDGYSPELIWQETEAERSCVPQGHTARLQVVGRGSSWVPVEVWSAAGAFHLFINRSQSGATDLSEVRRSTAQSEATCLAWKLAPCTLTPNTTRSLPYTSSVPWNLSWAGVQTAAPWQALGRKQFQEESWPSDSAAGFMSCPGRTVWLLL